MVRGQHKKSEKTGDQKFNSNVILYCCSVDILVIRFRCFEIQSQFCDSGQTVPFQSDVGQELSLHKLFIPKAAPVDTLLQIKLVELFIYLFLLLLMDLKRSAGAADSELQLHSVTGFTSQHKQPSGCIHSSRDLQSARRPLASSHYHQQAHTRVAF